MIIPLPAKFSFTRVERFGLVRSSNVLRSRYTGQRQVVSYPYALWEFEGKIVDYDSTEAALIRTFLVQLEGQKNTFRLPVPGYTKSSVNPGFPLTVSSPAAVRASQIIVTYPTPNIPVLKTGEFFTIQDELKIVTADVILNGGTPPIATIYFQPPLRKLALVATPVIRDNPYCLMHAASDDVGTWGLTPPIRHGLEIEAIEAFVE